MLFLACVLILLPIQTELAILLSILATAKHTTIPFFCTAQRLYSLVKLREGLASAV